MLRYQLERWRHAVAADANGELVVLDGDPFKLYFAWASWRAGALTELAWNAPPADARSSFVAGDLGFADLVLYSDPGEDELRRRKAADSSRSRRNFERNTAMRFSFRRWYETMSELDPQRFGSIHPKDWTNATSP